MKTFVEFHNLPASARWLTLAHSFLSADPGTDVEEAQAVFIYSKGASSPYRVRLMLIHSGLLTMSDSTCSSLPEAWCQACEALDFDTSLNEPMARVTSSGGKVAAPERGASGRRYEMG